MGALLNLRFLSKYIFCDCFYELIRSYVFHYNKYKDNKAVFYYECYIECALKIIEKMASYYDELLLKKNNEDVETVTNELIHSADKEEEDNFTHVCDFMAVLRKLNERLPSSRFKITFMLEDFRCSKLLKKEKESLNNSEYEVITRVMSTDPSKKEEA
jgi:hypothetical protein